MVLRNDGTGGGQWQRSWCLPTSFEKVFWAASVAAVSEREMTSHWWILARSARTSDFCARLVGFVMQKRIVWNLESEHTGPGCLASPNRIPEPSSGLHTWACGPTKSKQKFTHFSKMSGLLYKHAKVLSLQIKNVRWWPKSTCKYNNHWKCPQWCLKHVVPLAWRNQDWTPIPKWYCRNAGAQGTGPAGWPVPKSCPNISSHLGIK